MNYKDLYKSVTAEILEDLKSGTAPWTRPWNINFVGGRFPTNAVTGARYKGVNVPILWNAATKRRYPSHAWLTFRQATEAGGHVKKGEKSVTIIFLKWVKKENDDKEPTRPMVRTYSVFNIAQCEGLPDEFHPQPNTSSQDEALDHVDIFCADTDAEIIIGGDMACYIPAEDYIKIPNSADFEAPENYYATLLHEIIHWTGHSTRLNRASLQQLGSKNYAFEELVAELGAAMLCAYLGIKGELRHADYIKDWIKVLDNDDRAFFKASSYASQACDMVIELAEYTDKEAA